VTRIPDAVALIAVAQLRLLLTLLLLLLMKSLTVCTHTTVAITNNQQTASQVMPRAMAAEFYAEHAGRAFYEPLLTYMTSSEVLALQLEREAATSSWRALLGPTDSTNARTTAPGML
jgi:Nucleoside diphosphate kinase